MAQAAIVMEAQVNKEEVLKLSDECGISPSDTANLYECSADELLAFANACEKIGMEKAAKMVDHILKEGGGTYGDVIRTAT